MLKSWAEATQKHVTVQRLNKVVTTMVQAASWLVIKPQTNHWFSGMFKQQSQEVCPRESFYLKVRAAKSPQKQSLHIPNPTHATRYVSFWWAAGVKVN